MMAAACAERRSEAAVQALDEFARAIGLAFQIQDDLLDIEGDATLLGKATGADRAHDKATYPSSVGVETARRHMQELHARALAALAVVGSRAAPLASASDWLVLRKH
jgi:geranylgeranyl pyrophosphate synthase